MTHGTVSKLAPSGGSLVYLALSSAASGELRPDLAETMEYRTVPGPRLGLTTVCGRWSMLGLESSMAARNLLRWNPEYTQSHVRNLLLTA